MYHSLPLEINQCFVQTNFLIENNHRQHLTIIEMSMSESTIERRAAKAIIGYQRRAPLLFTSVLVCYLPIKVRAVLFVLPLAVLRAVFCTRYERPFMVKLISKIMSINIIKINVLFSISSSSLRVDLISIYLI